MSCFFYPMFFFFPAAALERSYFADPEPINSRKRLDEYPQRLGKWSGREEWQGGTLVWNKKLEQATIFVSAGGSDPRASFCASQSGVGMHRREGCMQGWFDESFMLHGKWVCLILCQVHNCLSRRLVIYLLFTIQALHCRLFRRRDKVRIGSDTM